MILLCTPASSRLVSLIIKIKYELFVYIWKDAEIGSIRLFLEQSQTRPHLKKRVGVAVFSYFVVCETHPTFFTMKTKQVEVGSQKCTI